MGCALMCRALIDRVLMGCALMDRHERAHELRAYGHKPHLIIKTTYQ